MLNDNNENPNFLTKDLHNLQMQEIPSNFLYFPFEFRERFEKFLISFSNLDHNRQPL